MFHFVIITDLFHVYYLPYILMQLVSYEWKALRYKSGLHLSFQCV